ncbi:MAG TPA: type III pantothenate kinase [Clostridiaceae bacterium]|nr:type III pantothenate kinase [Clostridiaceae bacterium]
MILTIDIGNSRISIALLDKEGKLVLSSSLSSVENRSDDEYIVLLRGIFDMYGFKPSSVESVIVASVVPPLSNVIERVILKLFRCKPLFVGPGIKTGLDIKVDHHYQVGADLVANTVAASAAYPKPFIVIDMGTATTVTAVNEKGELCGVIIIPGVQIALDALSENAAELPQISLTPPKGLLGTNTVDAMNSGIIYGTACMIDGLIDRLCDEFKTNKITAIATGGLASLIIPYCKHKLIYSPNLIFDGLYLIYKMNHKKSRRVN